MTLSAAERHAAGVAGRISRTRTRAEIERRSDAPRPLDGASGDIVRPILQLPAGSRVSAATATVTGATFHGRVADLQGARVSESPVIRAGGKSAPPTKTQRAFIIDFGRSVSVLGLTLGKAATIALVVPWLGADFARDAVYERPSSAPAGDDVGLSGLETMKLLVQTTGGPATAEAFAAACIITTGTLPSNVRASLNGRLAFWTQPGPLDRPVGLTGLAEEIAALLASADGPVTVTLALTTDSPGVLKLDFDVARTEVDLSAEARWAGRPGTDVAVAALQPQVVVVPLASDSAATWQIRELVARTTGDFPPWRAYPAQDSDAAGELGLRLDATFSVARRLSAAADVELHGVGLLLRPVATPTSLHVDLLPGAAAPTAGAKPLASAELALVPVQAPAEAAPAWHEILFDSVVDMSAADGAWLVVQARTGAAEWVATAAGVQSLTATLGAAQGGRWDRYPPVGTSVAVAQARILRLPLATENDPLVTIGWADLDGSSAAAGADRTSTTSKLARPAARPLLAAPQNGFAIELTVTSAATGTLTFERATVLYREQTP